MINDEHQDDEFVEACRKLKEACEQFIEAIRPFLDAVREAIRQAVEAFTRWLFSIRLKNIGVPERLAEWTARQWPWRWMPVEWILLPIREGRISFRYREV
jgi:hypothetical protein